MKQWISRLFVVGLLLVVYVFLWTPVRRGFTQHVAQPFVEMGCPTSPSGCTAVSGGGKTLVVRLPPKNTPPSSLSLPAPAGISFLLPALFLIALAPQRLYWLWFWLGHVVIGAIGMSLGALTVGGVAIASRVLHFTLAYLVDAYSLFVPALVLVRTRISLDTATPPPPVSSQSRRPSDIERHPATPPSDRRDPS